MKPLDPLRRTLSGTALIEASAGTGKTHTICTLFVRLVAERGFDVRDILVVTFTEAATAELRDRVRSRLFAELDALSRADTTAGSLSELLLRGDAEKQAQYRSRLRAALESFDQASIFTIHGFCHRLLREHAFECEVDFEAELVQDGGPIFDELVRDFWAKETYALDPLLLRLVDPGREPGTLAKILREVSGRLWADVLPERAAPPEMDALESFREAWLNLKRQWQAGRESVAAILSDTSSALNRNVYRLASVPQKLAEIDAFLSAEVPLDPIGAGSFLEKLTTEAITKGTKASGSPPTHPFFEACSRWDKARGPLVALGETYVLYLRRRFVEVLRTELGSKKERLGIQFFDDLLNSVDSALQGERGDTLAAQIRARYRAALIDEFQDTDFIQYRIFSRVYAGTAQPLLLIGDPKQAIYAFRGADIFAYLAAVRDASSAPETLDVNWRSDPALISAVAHLYGRPRHPFLFPGIELPAVRPRAGAKPALTEGGAAVPPLQLRFLSSEGRAGRSGHVTKTGAQGALPALVAADICRLLSGDHRIDGRPIVPSDIAVLVRSNDESARIQLELGALGVPSVSSRASSVFESDEAQDLALLMAALAEPSQSRLVRGALSTRLLGLSASDLFELRHNEASWDVWVGRFHEWHELWQRRGFAHVHRALLNSGHRLGETAVSTHLLGQAGGERALTNHLHLAELLERAARVGHLGVLGLCRWFYRARSGALGASDAAELRLETDNAAVELVTIHKSKGLEYPVVYCPSLWAPVERVLKDPSHDQPVIAFHDPNDHDRLKLDLRRSPDAQVRSVYEQRGEALRLSYVALTRAKHLCVVVTGDLESLGGSALGHLIHHQDDESDAWLRTQSHVDALDESQRLAETAAFVEASAGSMSLAHLDESAAPAYHPLTDTAPHLIVPAQSRAVSSARVISSYSALVRGTSGSEVDGTPALDRGEAEVVVDPSYDELALSPALAEQIPLRDFPRTSHAGSCFHSIYEEMDFQAFEPRALVALTREKLALFGYDPNEWSDTVVGALQRTLDTPLNDAKAALRLSSLPREKRLDEMAFMLSVRHTPGVTSTSGFVAQELATVFRAHAHSEPALRYADALAQLDFPALRGFLKGYIDLVFEHESRFFVVDYKSNYLGPRFADFRPAQLSQAMAHGHYHLQYHLYVLAVHRYLAHRMPDYDYDLHFGGVYYLFIKGMSPELGPASGVFFDRPTRALVEALDELFRSPEIKERGSS